MAKIPLKKLKTADGTQHPEKLKFERLEREILALKKRVETLEKELVKDVRK